MSKKKIVMLLIISLILFSCNFIPSSTPTLAIIPNQTVYANIDNDEVLIFNPQTLLAQGGSPFNYYNWSLELNPAPPSGLTIDAFTGVINITGSNTGISVGTTSFNVKVSDGNSVRIGTITLDVSNDTPGWMTVFQQADVNEYPLMDGVASKDYGASLFVVGGTPPYSWALDETYESSEDLTLAGLTIDAVYGIVRGTIMNSAAGTTVRFKVSVTDSEDRTAAYSPVYVIDIR